MKVGLRSWTYALTAALLLVPGIICGGLLYFYLNGELDNRRLITFMNFEQIAYRFDRSLAAFQGFVTDGGTLRFTREPIALLGTADLTLGTLPEGFVLKNLPVDSCDVQGLGGNLYLSCPILLPGTQYRSTAVTAGFYRAVWALANDDLHHFQDLKPSRVFLLDRRGKPVYQSDAPQPQEGLLKKKLVQDYIRLPLSKVGSAPLEIEGDRTYGFAMNLPESGLSFFAESPTALVMAPLWKPSTWFFASLVVGVAFLMLIGRLFIATLRDQIHLLANSVNDFVHGLQIPTQHRKEEFLTDFEPLLSALNEGTREIKRRLEPEAPAEPKPETP